DGAVARRHVVPAVLAARVVVGLHLDLEAGERDALAGGEADDAHGEAGAERAAPEDAGVGAGVVAAVLLAHVAGEAPGALLDLAREPVGHADGGDGGALPLRGAERERLDAALEGRADGRGVVADGGSHGGPGDGFSPLMTYSPRTFPSRGAAFFLSTPPRLEMIWGARRGGGQASVWGIGGDLASRNAGARRGGLPFTNPLPPCPPGNPTPASTPPRGSPWRRRPRASPTSPSSTPPARAPATASASSTPTRPRPPTGSSST